jgi:hypothetical protein
VQVKRLVESIMKSYYSSESGVRREFSLYSRWTILYIFISTHNCERGENIYLTDEEESEISTQCKYFFEKVWETLSSKGYVATNEDGQFTTQRAIDPYLHHVTDMIGIKNETLRLLSISGN